MNGTIPSWNTRALLKQAQQELDELRQAVDAQLAQRDTRIAELEAESYRNHEWARTWKAAAKSNRKDYQLFLAGYGSQMAQIKSLVTEREYWRKMYQLECSRVPFEQVPAPVNPDAPAGLETPDFSTELGWLRHIKLVAREFVDSVTSPIETWGNEEHPAWQAYWSLALSMGEFDLWQKEVATPAETVKVFGSMSQHNDWHVRNCNQCHKGSAQNDNTLVCPLEEALHIAALTDGKVSGDMAQRMGHRRGQLMPITWDCPERENISVPVYRLGMKND